LFPSVILLLKTINLYFFFLLPPWGKVGKRGSSLCFSVYPYSLSRFSVLRLPPFLSLALFLPPFPFPPRGKGWIRLKDSRKRK
jgi:hypothetical protein